MADYLEHSRRWQDRRQPADRLRVDYTRPGWIDPRDEEADRDEV